MVSAAACAHAAPDIDLDPYLGSSTDGTFCAMMLMRIVDS